MKILYKSLWYKFDINTFITEENIPFKSFIINGFAIVEQDKIQGYFKADKTPLLVNGEQFIFQKCYEFDSNGIAVVKIRDKHLFLKNTGELLPDEYSVIHYTRYKEIFNVRGDKFSNITNSIYEWYAVSPLKNVYYYNPHIEYVSEDSEELHKILQFIKSTRHLYICKKLGIPHLY